MSRPLANLASPNGLEVDPASKYLYLLSGNRLLRTTLPMAGAAFGPIETVMTLEAGGDGCAFDAWGNLGWRFLAPVGWPSSIRRGGRSSPPSARAAPASPT